jgi:methyl-accepting chemotaxis protein
MSFFDHPVGRILLFPGMKLMRVLKFPAKMTLMAIVLLVPLSWLTGQSLRVSHRELQVTRSAASASPLIGLALEVATQTQKHRGLVNLAFAGDVDAEAALVPNRAALRMAIGTLQAALLQRPELDLEPSWQPIRKVLERLAEGDVPHEAVQSFRLHSEQVAALRRFVMRCAESSGLLFEPEAAPFHLTHLVVEPLLAWTEALAQLRGRAAAALRKGEAGPAERAEIVAQIRLLAHATDQAEDSVAALVRAGEPAPLELARALTASRDYAQRADAIFASTALAGDARAWFDAGTAAIEQTLGIGGVATGRLQTLLDERARRLELQWWTSLAAGLGTLLGVAYLTLVFFRTSFGAVRVLQGSVTQLAAGDFATRVHLRGTDELAVIGRAIDKMTGRISEMVADIRSNAAMVAQAGMSLAEDTKALSERTESQASSLEQTAASVEEISSAVRKSAVGADTASAMATRVREIAEQGGSAIHSAVASMHDIQSSSKRVQEIVGVIEGISFQTNILALNAAVEAARAGEQGRGFAVVAAEVRSLAQRSATSAREIKALIGASAGHIETGATQMGGASRTFADIVQGIREVADSVHEIKTRTADQSSGLEQIAQAVRHIDEITQQNAQMVESAFHSSAQLSGRAEQLGAAVASFRLRQGVADEALALVRKAVDLHAGQGGSALARITEAADGFTDRDMYVFAFDRQGIYRAFAGKPEKVGTAVRDNPGVDGDKLVRDAFEQAARGGGWVDYDFANPQTGSVDLKTSYVEPITPDLLMGCGVYKTRDSATRAAATITRTKGIRAEQRQRLASIRGQAAA